MSITATVDYTAVPTVEITIATPDNSVMTAVVLYRKIGGAKTQTREQPAPGLAARTIDDVEMPWNTALQYVAVVTTASGTATYTSATVTVAPPTPWAIHPTIPSRSVQLDSGDFSALGVVSIGAETQAANSTSHPILGSPYPVITTSGSRNSTTGQLVLATVTSEERVAVNLLVDDQTPILICFPTDWGWDWDNGYYAIGDVNRDRFAQYGPEHRRVFTLPYTRVLSPAGDVQSDWSYAQMLANFTSYDALNNAFADYPSLTANDREA